MGARPLWLPLLEPAYLVLLIFVVVPCSFSQPRHTVSACSFTAYLTDVEASATCTIAFCVELWVNLTALLAVSAVPPRQFEVFGYAVLVCLCLFFSHRLTSTHSPSVDRYCLSTPLPALSQILLRSSFLQSVARPLAHS